MDRFFWCLAAFLYLHTTANVCGFSQGILETNVASDTSILMFSKQEFKNINKIDYYYDKQKLNKIFELNKQEQWSRLYKVLSEYVNNFGVRNFYKDTRLIWKLAKLTELLGDQEKAKSLYRLVLRHHHEGIDLHEIELYYDTLNTLATEQYVPVDYYYELVDHRKLIDTLRPPRGVLLNMGSAINSNVADYGPSLNLDNSILIFTSKRNYENRTILRVENEDLFFSIKNVHGHWSPAESIPELNTKYNEGSATLNKDGSKLYFSRCGCVDCMGRCDIFVVEMGQDSTWGSSKNLGINVNSISWDSHPSLSHNGDTLYFASDRIGGFGLSDIYITYKDKNGEWTPAQNMGPVINTRNNDLSPFCHPTYDIIYFASNGQLYSFGEYDIFKSHLKDSKWSEPQNIGPLINGKGNEFYFTIDSESNNLFYARSANKDLKKQDLYSFPLPMGAHPLANTVLTGSLKDSLTGKPFRGIVTIIDLDNGVEVAPKFLKADGSFEFSLIDKRNYLLIIQGDDYFRIEEAFFLDGGMELNKVTQPLAAKVKFESIEFGVGEAELYTSMYGDLNKIVNFLYDNLNFKLKVSGHTDSHGSEEFNLKLSKERAKVIRDYIVIFAGIHESRVDYEGYGSSFPIVEELTEFDKALNRRVEFEIYRSAKGGY